MLADFGQALAGALASLRGQAPEAAVKDICVALLRVGVLPERIAALRARVTEELAGLPADALPSVRARAAESAVAAALADLLGAGKRAWTPQAGRANVVVFVGLQGVGKTTSLCKYALHYKQRGMRVGIVCADTFRAGAFAQVEQNATRIGVPYYGGGTDPVRVAREGVARFRRADFELILVDTSGRHVQEDALFDEMRELIAAVRPDSAILVLDAGTGAAAEAQAAAFRKAAPLGAIILSKFDGAERAGGALNAVAAAGCPVVFVGTGEHMDGLEDFDARRFVGQLLGHGDLEGLAERMARINIDQDDLLAKLKSGGLRLADFKQIYDQLMGLGPLSGLLKMIPGMQGMPLPDEAKFRRIQNVLDSLSRGELGSNGDMFAQEPARVARVARGSGVPVEFVTEVIQNFKQMSSLMRRLMGNPMFAQMFGGGGPGAGGMGEVGGLGGLGDLFKGFRMP